jgi:cellulose synthase/poly-beta-1,6-N-acetylglucosamine synthase-like glycosyltransferase
MSVRNERDFVHRSLVVALEQDYPPDHLEILVADGMSTDGTREIVQSLAAQHPHVRLLVNPGQIVSTGLNLALAQARGEVIIRVDGHCEIGRDYVRRCVQYLQENDIDGVGGPIDTIGRTLVGEAISFAMSVPFGVGGSTFRTATDKALLVDTIPFPAYTRAIIERAGLYDEELVRDQDDEYNYRIRELGGKLLLAPELRSRYYSRSSLRSLWRQYFQYGYWKVRVMQKHPRQMRLRQFAPPAFVGALLISAVLAIISPLSGAALTLVAGPYLLANLAASLWIARKQGWKYLPLLPLVFTILHVSYGLGFLIGLVKFWNRWGDKVGKTPIWHPVDAPNV